MKTHLRGDLCGDEYLIRELDVTDDAEFGLNVVPFFTSVSAARRTAEPQISFWTVHFQNKTLQVKSELTWICFREELEDLGGQEQK